MTTIENGEITITEIKKSKFISVALNVQSYDEVLQKIEEIKKLYSNANHYCFSCVVDKNKFYSDDGEPSGTAGKPILNVIEKSNITNCLIVVVRYFGGIKLGAGPLTRAYSNCAKEALKNAKIKELKLFTKICFHISFEQAFNIYLLSSSGLFLLQKRVGNDFEIVCEKQNKDEVLRELAKFDVSKIEIKEVWL